MQLTPKREGKVHKRHKNDERPIEGRTSPTVLYTGKEAQFNKVMDFKDIIKVDGKNEAEKSKESATPKEMDRVQQECKGEVHKDNIMSEDLLHLNWAEETA